MGLHLKRGASVSPEILEYLQVDPAKLRALSPSEFARVRELLGKAGIPVEAIDATRQ